MPKPAGRFRIVTVGDSLTFGWGVGDADAFSAQLEQQWRASHPDVDLDVANLGVPGYNTRQEITLLHRYIERLQPDLVVVGFYTNDVPEAFDDQPGTAPAEAVGSGAAADPGRLMYINPTPSSWWESALRRSRAAYTIGRTAKRLMSRGEHARAGFALEMQLLSGERSPDLEEGWRRVEQEFTRLQALARGRFRVAILALPCLEQVKGEFQTADYQPRLRAIADRLGFEVIDPLPDLARQDRRPDRLFIPYDRNHPSSAGHQIIGGSLVRFFDTHRGMLTAQQDAARPDSAK
jgi:lysophospholipase L1-like esterase